MPPTAHLLRCWASRLNISRGADFFMHQFCDAHTCSPDRQLFPHGRVRAHTSLRTSPRHLGRRSGV
jgi:hypothetical protein